MDEVLKNIKKKIAEMKRIEGTGFSDPKKATEYFEEKELILEGMVKAIESIAGQEAAAATAAAGEVEALKSTVKSLREEIKAQASSPRELSRRELLYSLGKGIAAAWAGNNKTLAELSFSPNLKADNWTNPRDVSWG